MVEEKKKRFGNKLASKNNLNDKNDELARTMMKRLEISEAKRNYWLCYIDGTTNVKPADKNLVRKTRTAPDWKTL